MKYKAAGCVSISTVFTSIILLCVSSTIIIIIITIIIIIIIVIVIIHITVEITQDTSITQEIQCSFLRIVLSKKQKSKWLPLNKKKYETQN